MPLPIPLYRAEVYAGGSSKPVRVLEGMSPVFTLEGLAPGGDYVVTLTAINRKGASPPVSLEAFTLKVAENRMSEYLGGCVQVTEVMSKLHESLLLTCFPGADYTYSA